MRVTGLWPSPTREQVAGLATVAQVAITYFIAVIVAMHFLRPDLNPLTHATSEYAVGSYGFLMTSAFISMSLGSLALAFGLYRWLPEPAISRSGLGLLGAWAVCLLVAAAFPADPQGAPESAAGAIHRINGSIAFLSLSVGAMLLSRRFEHDEKWRPFHRLALLLSLLMLAQFVILSLTIASGVGYPGLGQRIFIATLVTWLLLTAARLRAIAIGFV